MYRFCWNDGILAHHGLYAWTLAQVKAQIEAWRKDTPEYRYWYEREEE